mgnify:CR=1 FL=1
MVSNLGLGNFAFPNKYALLDAYSRLYKKHPKHLLPLETELPNQLKWESRDEYRIIMTMILSQRIDDRSLSVSLGKLFSAHPTIESLRDLITWNDAKDLLVRCGFKVDGPAAYNVDRFWALLRLYFDEWSGTIESNYIETLKVKRGYGPKFTRTLSAYHLGDRTVLPLDGKGFDALRKVGLYARDANINRVRTDIERKLSGEMSISLIDFHELLRFRGQTSGRDPKHFNRVIIGWNAWRLLCSLKRAEITRDWKWIYEHLVRDESIAQELWHFFREVADP